MIPEEDLGPSWLRDYGSAGFGTIEADIAGMEEFARKLANEVQSNYAPHMAVVSDAMMTELPPPAGTFAELVDFMTAHRDAQEGTQDNLYRFADGTQRFASAAQTIGQEYQGSDAFSQARVRDVNKAFDTSTRSTTVGYSEGDV